MTIDHSQQDELRAAATAAARRYKSGWLELGGLLQRVQREQAYRLWGYKTFERYCSSELFIKPATALSLSRGFAILKRHEPALVEEPASRVTPPPFEVIQVLVKADAKQVLTDQAYAQVRSDVLHAEGSGEERAEQLRQRLIPPAPKEAPPQPKLRLVEVALRKHTATARMLHEELNLDRRIPPAVREHARLLVMSLEALSGNNEAARA